MIDLRDRRSSLTGVSLLLLLLLFLKYAWTALVFDVPLGYDPGMYRYLFLRYSASFPFLPSLDPWGMEQPTGLFLLSALPLKFLSVDLMLGWIWNLVPVFLSGTFAWIFYRREGAVTGVCVLLMALLSIAQYDGFIAMYWKTFASLFFMILTFTFLERKSWMAIPAGALTIAIHHQTGFLFLVTVGSWAAIRLWMDRKKPPLWLFVTVGVGALLGILFYAPIWSTAVLPHFVSVFSGASMPAGSFPPPAFFFLHQGILLFFGLGGFVISFQRERGTLWQWAVLWSGVFVVMHFFFYRRFFLHLDFFLVPFAARGLVQLWKMHRSSFAHVLIALALLAQAVASAYSFAPEMFPFWCRMLPSVCSAFPPIVPEPEITVEALREMSAARHRIPTETLILSLEPTSTPWLRGWMPDHRVAGPGIFSSPWDYDGWERFLLGNESDRRELLRDLRGPVFLFVSPGFLKYYGAASENFLNDPCFQTTEFASFLSVSCL